MPRSTLGMLALAGILVTSPPSSAASGIFVAAISGDPVGPTVPRPASTLIGQLVRERVDEATDRLGVPFVANHGQLDERVAFHAPLAGGAVFVTTDGEIVYRVATARADESLALRETLVGAAGRRARGIGEISARISSFRGNRPERWARDLAAFQAVALAEVYPGVELVLQARGASVEKVFHIAPGADPTCIRVQLSGIRALAVDANGELLATTDRESLRFSCPVAFQQGPDGREPVDVVYRVAGDTYGFALGAYDPARELVIDPTLISTFVGGDGAESGRIAIDAGDDVILYGQTSSSDFPATMGVWDESPDDLFLARFDTDLTTLKAATFLGGSGSDNLGFHALDAAGNVYVAATTLSTDFPTTSGAYDTSANGSADTVVSLLSADFSSLLASTYLGGSRAEGGGGWGDPVVHVDPDGNVVVAGFSNSTDYPTTAGAWDRTYNDYDTDDVVVSKLDAGLTTLLASTYIGGSLWDVLYDMAIDGDGNIYVTGRTSSSNYPTSVGAYHGNYGDAFPYYDGFVSKFSSDLTTLRASTYLGSGGSDIAWAVEPAPGGGAYVAGTTDSSAFPTTVGAWDRTWGGGTSDGFVTLLDPTFGSLAASTFIGGGGADATPHLTRDSVGNLHLGGNTSSADYPLTVDALDATLAGDYDAIYSVLAGDLSTLVYSTLVGGSVTEGSGRAQINSVGDVYLVGTTASADFATTVGAWDRTHGGGGGDLFLMRMGNIVDPGPTPYCCDCPMPVPPSDYMCFSAFLTEECETAGCAALAAHVCDANSGTCVGIATTTTTSTTTTSTTTSTTTAPVCGDGRLDGDEQCDDGNDVDADGCSAECVLEPPEAYMFYRTKTPRRMETLAAFGPLTLTDALEDAPCNVWKPLGLGLPADVDEAGVVDDRTNLRSYLVKRPRGAASFVARQGVRVVNACNDLQLALIRPSSMLVPSTKSLTAVPDPPEPGTHAVNHFLCYVAKAMRRDAEGQRLARFPKGTQVNVADQFQTRRFTLTKVTRLCAPVIKTVDPDAPPVILGGPDKGQPKPVDPAALRRPDEYLVCYLARLARRAIPQDGCGCDTVADPGCKGVVIVPKQAAHSPVTGIRTANQFGDEALETIREQELCLPSQVTLP